MSTNRIVSALLAGCAALLLGAAPQAGAQRPEQQHEHGTAAPEKADASKAKPAPAKPDAAMQARCTAMMAGHDKMMADMKAADARLDDLVAKMNAASGQAKTDASAAVLNELVAQRRTMREGMMGMHQHTMKHMMEHMQSGGSTAMCPMMKSTGDMKH